MHCHPRENFLIRLLCARASSTHTKPPTRTHKIYISKFKQTCCVKRTKAYVKNAGRNSVPLTADTHANKHAHTRGALTQPPGPPLTPLSHALVWRGVVSLSFINTRRKYTHKKNQPHKLAPLSPLLYGDALDLVASFVVRRVILQNSAAQLSLSAARSSQRHMVVHPCSLHFKRKHSVCSELLILGFCIMRVC